MIDTKRITNEYVQAQIAAGEERELDFKQYLENRGWIVEQSQGNFSYWDLKGTRDGITITWEMKYNSGIEQYGTCFVEYYQSGYPSGMNTTKADYQCHSSEYGEYRCLKTSELDDYIKSNNLRLINTYYIAHNGKTSAQGYRVPFDELTFVKK